MLRADCAPVDAEMEFLVRMAEPVEKVSALKARPAIEPHAVPERLRAGQSGSAQCVLDDIEGGHFKPWMTCAKPPGESADHVVVRVAFGMGRKHRAADLQKSMPAGGIEIVVLEEGRGRQYDIGHRRGLGHELLVHANKHIIAAEP